MHFSFVWFRSFSVSSVPIQWKNDMSRRMLFPVMPTLLQQLFSLFIILTVLHEINTFLHFIFDHKVLFFSALISSTSIVKISYHWPLVYVKRAFNPSIINMKNVSCSMNRTCLSMVVHFFQWVYTIQTETGSWNNHHGFVRIPWI